MTPISKSAFVLSLSTEMPIAEVVQRAGKAGIVITPKYVSNIRSEARIRAGKKKAATPSKPSALSKKTTTKKTAVKNGPTAGRASGSGAMSKSDFIRSQARTMPAADVVTAAKRVGLTISSELVYKVRGRAAASARKAPLAKSSPTKAPQAKAPQAARRAEPVVTRPTSQPKGAMTFRGAIKEMIRHAVDDYGAAIERRLLALLTEDDGADEPGSHKAFAGLASAKQAPASKKATARAAVETKRPVGRPKGALGKAKSAGVKTPPSPAPARGAAQDDHSYRPRIIAALEAASAGLSRSQLIRALELKPSEEGRFGTALVALRGSNAVTLQGTKRNAVYRRTTSA